MSCLSIKQQSFRMSIVSLTIVSLLSFWHNIREDSIHLEIGGDAYEINVDFGH